MNHLKPFNGISEAKDDNLEDYTPEQSNIQKQLKAVSKNCRLGTDKLGNDEVFLFSKNGISIEVFDMPKNDKGQTEYNISYKRDGDEWEELITTQLMASVWSVIDGKPVEYDGDDNHNDRDYDDDEDDGYECEECGGDGYIVDEEGNDEECYNCDGQGWIQNDW